MITTKQLLDAGYKKYPSHKDSDKSFCRDMYQKSFEEGSDLKYFIEVHHWVFPIEIHHWVFPNAGIRFAAEAHMYLGDDSFHVQLDHEEDRTIVQMESFFDKIYKKLGCIPDKLNQKA